jgi:hypothetical protein
MASRRFRNIVIYHNLRSASPRKSIIMPNHKVRRIYKNGHEEAVADLICPPGTSLFTTISALHLEETQVTHFFVRPGSLVLDRGKNRGD